MLTIAQGLAPLKPPTKKTVTVVLPFYIRDKKISVVGLIQRHLSELETQIHLLGGNLQEYGETTELVVLGGGVRKKIRDILDRAQANVIVAEAFIDHLDKALKSPSNWTVSARYIAR